MVSAFTPCAIRLQRICSKPATISEKSRYSWAIAEHAVELGGYALRRSNHLEETHRIMGQVAGLGLHNSIDLVTDHRTKVRALDGAEIVMLKCHEL